MTQGLAGKRILIAADEFIIAADIASEVAALGAVVVGPAATVEGALKAVKNADLDGAILDVTLRGEAAFPVADALTNRDIPFVFATAYTIPEIPAPHANVTRFEKPTPPNVLCCALDRAMSTTREK